MQSGTAAGAVQPGAYGPRRSLQLAGIGAAASRWTNRWWTTCWRIVEQTRTHESLALGVSPRGAQALYRAAQALALVEGRDYVIPDDIKRLAVPIFAHRVVVNTRVALAQRRPELGERIIEDILQHIDVPF